MDKIWYMRESVLSLKEKKTTQHCFFYFQIARNCWT